MKLSASLFFLSTLFVGPAMAQSFWPNSAGARYCELRRLGVSREQASTIAIRENMRPGVTPEMVQYNGKQVPLPVLEMAKWAARCDPGLR